MAPTPACKLCETRRPRRACPGVGGDICALCCGAEREVTVTCPLECEYLQEAHRHEKLPAVDPRKFPNRDVKLTEHFVDEHQALLTFVGVSLLEGALQAHTAVDTDVREALESLIRTYRTRESGLYYETRPANLLAAGIHQHLQQGFEEYRRLQRERSGLTGLRDAEILGALVFWQQMALTYDNGRRLGRSFLGFLRESLAGAGVTFGPRGVEAPRSPTLITP